jgi:hypothetical protein
LGYAKLTLQNGADGNVGTLSVRHRIRDEAGPRAHSRRNVYRQPRHGKHQGFAQLFWAGTIRVSGAFGGKEGSESCRKRLYFKNLSLF